ncbi:MAG: hypothetical protein ABW203_02185 [Novosphingobium sp.]
MVTWFGRLLDDTKRPHWWHDVVWLAVPGLDTLIHIVRGFTLIWKKDDD